MASPVASLSLPDRQAGVHRSVILLSNNLCALFVHFDQNTLSIVSKAAHHERRVCHKETRTRRKLSCLRGYSFTCTANL